MAQVRANNWNGLVIAFLNKEAEEARLELAKLEARVAGTEKIVAPKYLDPNALIDAKKDCVGAEAYIHIPHEEPKAKVFTSDLRAALRSVGIQSMATGETNPPPIGVVIRFPAAGEVATCATELTMLLRNVGVAARTDPLDVVATPQRKLEIFVGVLPWEP